jgi:hypothetical protein
MTIHPLSRRAIFGAGAITLLGPALGGLGGGRAAAATPQFTGHPAVKQAMQMNASGIFNVADMGNVQTLLLVLGGAATEVHARRGNTYLPKQPGATSVRSVTTAQYEQLLQFSGGVDHIVPTARQPAFANLLNAPATHAPAAACPPDFATMKPIQQQAIKSHLNLPQNQKYAPCFGPLTQRGDWLRELFGGEANAADNAELVFLRVSLDHFFDDWNITYNVREDFFGFKLFGITAIWDLHSVNNDGG